MRRVTFKTYSFGGELSRTGWSNSERGNGSRFRTPVVTTFCVAGKATMLKLGEQVCFATVRNGSSAEAT